MIYQEITKSDFCNNKRLRENFSYDGLSELYDHLNEINEKYELDPIALCCEYAEDEIEKVLKYYDLETLNDLQDKTYIIWDETEGTGKNGRVLYEQF